MTSSENNRYLDKDEVIADTLRSLHDLNRLTAIAKAAKANHTASNIDSIISQTTGRSRKNLIADILGYMNRRGLAIFDAENDQGFDDYEEDDLYEIDHAGLEDFVGESLGKKNKSSLKKLKLFSDYIGLRVDKIISHQCFKDARESMDEQNHPKVGKLFQNGLNVIMPKFGFLQQPISFDQTIYHGLRMVADDERDLHRNDCLEDLLSAERYAKAVEQSFSHGIKSRPTIYNLPSIEGVEVTTDLTQTQGLVVLRSTPGVNKVWRNPLDSKSSDLQIFQHIFQPSLVEVLIKDNSFLSPGFLKDSYVRADIMLLARKNMTLFQDYLARLINRLDYLQIPCQYVDINGKTRQIERLVQPPQARSSGRIILEEFSDHNATNVVHVDFRSGGK